MTTSTQSPQPGDDLYLDGLWYMLGLSRKLAGSTFRSFFRPDVLAIQQTNAKRADFKQTEEYKAIKTVHGRAEALDKIAASVEKNSHWQGNFNYKANGETLEEHLKFMSVEGLLNALDEQSDQLVSTGGRLSKVWARAARSQQHAELKDRKTGAWVIAEEREEVSEGGGSLGWRILLKPTCVRIQHVENKSTAEAPVYVSYPNEADLLVAAVLASGDVPPLVASFTSWKPPAGYQIVRW